MIDKTVHVVVSGRVQGVGFRFFVETEALKHGVHGWVRNRRDGTVEAVFAGTPAQVEMMLDSCREGPPASRVEKVDVTEAPAGELKRTRPGEQFSMLPTV